MARLGPVQVPGSEEPRARPARDEGVPAPRRSRPLLVDGGWSMALIARVCAELSSYLVFSSEVDSSEGAYGGDIAART